MGVGRREKEGKETSRRGSQDEPAQDKEENGRLDEQREEINTDVEEREENSDVEEREKERERGSNLRRQRLASPTAQVLVAQTTQPVQKNRLRDEL